MKQVIGTVTTYRSTDAGEHAYLNGYQVKIVAILRAGDPDAADHLVQDDDHLAQVGGLRREDRVEVAPYLETKARYSFATSDARVCDLEDFERLLGR